MVVRGGNSDGRSTMKPLTPKCGAQNEFRRARKFSNSITAEGYYDPVENGNCSPSSGKTGLKGGCGMTVTLDSDLFVNINYFV